MGASLCAASKIEQHSKHDGALNPSNSANSSSSTKGGRRMVEKDSSMSDVEYFTSLAKGTTLQVSSRNKFVNDIPSTLLQVATDKTKTSRPSDGTLPFLQQALVSVPNLGLDSVRAGQLASYMTLMNIADGESFIKKGEEVKGLYVVESGAITLPNGKTIKAGGVFGADALLKKMIADGPYIGCTVGAVQEIGETKQQQEQPQEARLWAIHRLIYQAVLIQIAKDSSAKSKSAIDQIPFFAPLPASSKQMVSNALQNGYRKYKAGTRILAQGEPANSILFIISGEVVVYQKTRGDAEAKEVNRHGPGKFFGESSIKNGKSMQESVRNADVVAAESGSVECYELNRDAFLRSCGSLSELALRQGKARLLKGVDLLSSLSREEHTEIASMLKMHTFKKGEYIIKQGDMGDEFYIIDNGEVEFYRKEDNESQEISIGRFFQNQWFGEGSLTKPAPRRASAVAQTDSVVCFSLSGAEYRALFGEQIKEQMAQTLAIRKAADEPGNASEIRANDLSGIRMLGQGSYGKVTLVRHKSTGKTYALKQITREKVERLEQEVHVQSEKLLLSEANHPFVCNLVRTFRNNHSVYMLMEPVLGGELFTHLRKSGKFKPDKAQFYLAQVALVFEHLHSKNIIFRDLKPENLLINSDGFLKMVDFGLAKKCAGRTYTLCGTPAYASPEVYAVVGHDKGVDWWTFGVLMHELLAGYTPFVGNEPNQIFAEITRYSKHYPRVAFPSHFPEPAQSILKDLLHPKPSERLGNLTGGARDVKRHPYFVNYDFQALLQKQVKAPWIPPIEDSYDGSNFRKQNTAFELEIDEDDGSKDGGWADSF